MSGKGQKYSFWLHPGDRENAICIAKLDDILDQIDEGSVKKGTLSKEIAKALYMYFTRQGGDFASVTVSAMPNKAITLIEVVPQLVPHEGQLLETASFSKDEQSQGGNEANNIKNSLLDLTMSL
jgi:hypothetical protein